MLAAGSELVGVELGSPRSEGEGGEEQFPLEDGFVLKRVSDVSCDVSVSRNDSDSDGEV